MKQPFVIPAGTDINTANHLARAIASGVEIDIIDDDTFIYKTPEGTELKFIGGTPFDVSFTHSDPEIQSVNITRLEKAIKQRKVRFQKLHVDMHPENMRMVLLGRDVDPKIVAYILMHKEVLDSPLICSQHNDNDVIILDGTHRAACHFLLREYGFKCYMIKVKDLKPYKIRIFINGEERTETHESITRSYQFNKHPTKE